MLINCRGKLFFWVSAELSMCRTLRTIFHGQICCLRPEQSCRKGPQDRAGDNSDTVKLPLKTVWAQLLQSTAAMFECARQDLLGKNYVHLPYVV